MTTFEILEIIEKLLVRLIKVAKGREAQVLVQQIQQHQLELYHKLKIADAQIAKLEKENADLKNGWGGGRGATLM